MTPSMPELSDRLFEFGVTRVVTEATGDCWRPPFYLLEDRFETWLVNAGQGRPGRHRSARVNPY
jgi:transposase